jgi:hypothetical protein
VPERSPLGHEIVVGHRFHSRRIAAAEPVSSEPTVAAS